MSQHASIPSVDRLMRLRNELKETYDEVNDLLIHLLSAPSNREHLTELQFTNELPRPSMLDGFLSEAEYARQRGVSIRTCQRDRALRQSPPYVIMGRQVYYRIEAVREWLVARENLAQREPQFLARKRRAGR